MMETTLNDSFFKLSSYSTQFSNSSIHRLPFLHNYRILSSHLEKSKYLQLKLKKYAEGWLHTFFIVPLSLLSNATHIIFKVDHLPGSNISCKIRRIIAIEWQEFLFYDFIC